MFSHVMIGTNDIEESRHFMTSYLKRLDLVLGKCTKLTGQKRYFYYFNGSSFVITQPIDGNAATVANGSTIGFNLESTEQGDAWHQAGIDNGGTSIEEPPGIRNYEKFSMYLAYLKDPTGHKLCAGYAN